MIKKRQLLCTFSTTKSYKKVIENIKKFYSINSGKFFIFTITTSPGEVIITYNVESLNNDNKDLQKFPNTISVHRKKETNTLYTLNAMNQIIKDENNGEFDKKHVVKWNFYINSLIITGNPQLRILPIKLLEVLE